MVKSKNNKIVLVYGHFNILHPGHLRLLRFAKECGQKLIAAVSSDRIANQAAHVPQRLRLEGVKANSWVDKAFIFDTNINKLISKIKPDIVVKGKEHENQLNSESKTIKKYGGKLIFSSGESIFSSIDLLKKEFSFLDSYKLNLQKNYLLRHNINASSLKKIINNFKKIKICVIGDLIIDQYIICDPIGMSQEDPTIVITPIDKINYIGGAGIVASHGASLGAEVFFLSVAGKDKYNDFAKTQLKNNNVNFNLIIDDTRPTTLKQRYRSKDKTLLRVNNLHQNNISSEIQDNIYKNLYKKIKDIDVIIFSDFNYGCLPQKLVDKITTLAIKNKIKLIADSQSSSQVGDIARFKDCFLLTPTEHEARVSTHNSTDGIVFLTKLLRKKSNCKHIFLKLGAEGMFIHTLIKESKRRDDKIEAINKLAKDVTGAGDSFLMISALSIAANSSLWEAAYLGMIASAIQVSSVGNIPIAKNKIVEVIDLLN